MVGPPGKTGTILALLLCALPVQMETVTSAEVYMNTSFRIDDDGIGMVVGGNTGGFRIGIDSARDDTVKASVRFSLENTGVPTLEKAYIKTRFPSLVPDTSVRFTAGKAPLAWGKGFLFNAGDLIFGASPPIGAPSNSAYRTATDWMALAYLPIGGFSFTEFVYLPPIEEEGTPMARNRAGGRVFFTLDFPLIQSIETGYLFKENRGHNLYAALDGSLFFDWYGAASAVDVQSENRDYTFSFGIFRIFTFIPDIPLTVRVETLALPAEGNLLWYPSLGAGFVDSVQLSFQGVFSADSGLGGLVCSWSPLKGFTLSGTLFKHIEKGDLWKEEMYLYAGLQYLF